MALNGRPDAGAAVRLFFAVWPDEQARAALGALARELSVDCGGRAVRAANLHLTLAFLGDVSAPRMPLIAQAVDAIRVEPFALEFDECGYWRHNRIVWAGATQCPPALRVLVDALGEALQAHGFRREGREYVPHITLLRDARREPKTGMARSIGWRARDFTLVQSVRRERALAYEIVRSWSSGDP
ncbi:MAG: RNA 2',3'-cyclic phosphodiesterase [Betaproteobacteria bacterium]